jgi:hypothetical protein
MGRPAPRLPVPGCQAVAHLPLALSHLRARKDTPFPYRSLSAIEGLNDAGEYWKCAKPGARKRFLRAAFFVSTAFAQATPNQVRLGPVRWVDPEPDKWRGGRAKCGG